MLELDAGITVGEDAVQCLRPDQLPVIDAQDLEAVGSLAPEMIEGELDAFDRGPDIFVMAVDHDQAAGAMAVELGDDIAQEPGKCRRGDIDCAGKGWTAARARLRAVAIGNGWRDEPAALLGDLGADPCRDHCIDTQWQMPAMLLGGADRNEDGGAFSDASGKFRPAQIGEKNSLRHPDSPWILL